MDNTATPLTWLTIAVAVILIVAPIVFGFAGAFEGGNSIGTGLFIGAMSVIALLVNRRWEAWPNLIYLNLLAGAWIFFSPILFHYNGDNPATWTQILGGIAVAVLATIQLWIVADKRLPAR
jgi:hypothetical protein